MADEAENTQEETVDDVPAQEESTDWKAEARKWETRAKANHTRIGELEARISELDGSKSDLDKARERIQQLEKHNADLEHARLTSEVASAKNVDAQLLQGSTREELEAYADKLIAWRGDAPRQAAAPALGRQPSQETHMSESKKLIRELFNKE